MCRQNHVRGFCAITFGLGLLAGCWVASGFWCCVLAVGVIAWGVLQFQKK